MKTAAEAGTPSFGLSVVDPETIPQPYEDTNLGVVIGEPWYPNDIGERIFVSPFQPHVFSANVQIQGDKDGRKAPAKQMKVIFAHGQARTDRWLFADGTDVREVIEAYNETFPESPIEFAAACNLGRVTIPKVIHPIESILSAGIMHLTDTLTILTANLEQSLEHSLHWPDGWLEKFTVA